MLENPYFGTLVSDLKLRENENIASVDYQDDSFAYNSGYIDSLEVDEVITHLSNIAMHKALSHRDRGKGRVKSLWKLASDYAINDLLVENGFKMPPIFNYSSRFEKLYAEEIYTTLLQESDFRDRDDEMEVEKEKDKNRDIEEYELFLKELENKLKKRGSLPKGIERVLGKKEKYNSKISWRDRLYRYINTHSKQDYKMFPPNKKYLYRDIVLPSIYSQELKIVVAIDTSASIDRAILEIFLNELYAIMEAFPHYVIEFIEADAKIQNIIRLTPLERVDIDSLKGGGGTDFRPVFKYIERENEDFKFLIYFTDGIGSFPKDIPNIDTLWVMPKKRDVPFGEVLDII